MTLFVVVVIFQKMYYFQVNCYKKFSKFGKDRGYEAVCVCTYRVILGAFYLIAIAAVMVCIVVTIVVLTVLPLNNAIDQASNQIYAIYQASVTMFAALVTFQVFFRQTNSIFGVFIRAADRLDSKEPTKWKGWTNMSEKEKEIYLGDKFLSHINFILPESEQQIQPEQSEDNPDPSYLCCISPSRRNGYSEVSKDDNGEEVPSVLLTD